jgi:hypothetical protein
MEIKNRNRFLSRLVLYVLCIVSLFGTGCKTVKYNFNDVAIPADLKSIRINLIENRARYINPQLSPQLTERLRQKIVNQTKLTQTNSDNADWDVSAYITDYSVTTSGISDKQQVTNRLNVAVHITVIRHKENDEKEYDVNRGFDFSASLSLQAAEAQLADDILRSLTDDIFGRIFSEW